MIVGLITLALVLAVSYFTGQRKFALIAAIIIGTGGLLYYVVLLSSGDLRTFFWNDPYSKIYPNLWDHALRGDFGIDPRYAFREYFITYSGMSTVYFGFMPAILRGIAEMLGVNTYNFNLGNLSIVLAAAFALAAVLYCMHTLALFADKTKKYSLSAVVALLFASPLVYTAIWGRVHNEVIAWGACWGIIFISFFLLWTFGQPKQRHWWWGLTMGASVGMAVLSRPTVALTIAAPFALLTVLASVRLIRHKQSADILMLIPGIMTAAVLIFFAMYINHQRWGSPLTFVKMHRHVELLRENPKRGNDLKKAGEFNLNRVVSSSLYYLLPTKENVTREWPYVEIDQYLHIMDGAPQYDYIEGSRVPIIVSSLFLVVLAGIGLGQVRYFKKPEQYAIYAVLAGGVLTVIALCAVYAVALRYSADLLPLLFFGAMLCLIGLQRQKDDMKLRWQIGWHVLLVVSVYLTTVTTLQYKIISGQIDLSQEFRANLSRLIHYPPKQGAKLFIIDGESAPGIRY